MHVFDIDWITDSLAIGGCLPADGARELAAAHRVRGVVDVRAEACDDELALARHGVALLHLPTADKQAIAPAMIHVGVTWVNRALDAGARVLIHCEYGIGRSALLAMCVLVARGVSPVDALTRVKDSRAVASPSPDQLQAFLAFALAQRAATGAPSAIPSFDRLARIAYRHLRVREG